jgi:hypothetical protein
VPLTDGGRFTTALLKVVMSVATASHWPALTSDEIWSSWLLRLSAWSDESRPEPPPQATRNETAKPSPPARSARGAKPIRRLTLEAARVCGLLEGP